MSEKLQRKMMAHFVDTSMRDTTPSWYRLGKDFEEFNVDMNPDTEVGKNILGESTFVHNGYQISADANPYYAREGDALFSQLQTIIDDQAQYGECASYALDVHMWEPGTTSGTYKAYRQECYLVPTSYGGDTSGYQIPFTISYVGERKSGYFTPDGNGGGSFALDT